MKFISYTCVFIGKINEIYILFNEKLNREIQEFSKLFRDTFQTKIEPGFREINPKWNSG